MMIIHSVYFVLTTFDVFLHCLAVVRLCVKLWHWHHRNSTESLLHFMDIFLGLLLYV